MFRGEHTPANVKESDSHGKKTVPLPHAVDSVLPRAKILVAFCRTRQSCYVLREQHRHDEIC